MGPPDPVPALVTVHLWRVPPRHVPTAVAHMALDRLPLRGTPGLRFAKLLGTGTGRTFHFRDADPLRWGLLAAWGSTEDAARFESSRVAGGWTRVADEHWRGDLVPLASRGRWARREPFGRPTPRRLAGPVASVTRARLTPHALRTFWSAVPPVSAALQTAPGLRLALGIGEAPVGLQGTFSVWDSTASLLAFATRGQAHADVVRRTPEERWYAEELFARFAVVGGRGTVDGRDPLAATSPSAATHGTTGG